MARWNKDVAPAPTAQVSGGPVLVGAQDVVVQEGEEEEEGEEGEEVERQAVGARRILHDPFRERRRRGGRCLECEAQRLEGWL